MRSFFTVADERARRFVEHALVEEARQTGRETEACAAILREILHRGGMLVREDGGWAFAFKLHQFIGQGRALFATEDDESHPEYLMLAPADNDWGEERIPEQ
jgi:hypothetical protein